MIEKYNIIEKQLTLIHNFSTGVPIRIVPPPGVGVPNFEIPEGNGPLLVCVEINNPFQQDILAKTVTATLNTADGSALGKLNNVARIDLIL